jgi:hypothetical protein
VKFLRHLAAVAATVAVIVGLGMLWAHASGGTGIGSELRRAPSHAALVRLEHAKADRTAVGPDDGIHPADVGNLIRTGEIEAILAAVVITASAVRRRQRRQRRSAATS